MYGPNVGSPESRFVYGLCRNMCNETSWTGLKVLSVLAGYNELSVFTLIMALAGIVNNVVDG